MAILLTEWSIRGAADPRTFDRGRDVFESGSIRRILVEGETVTATVAGARPYRVRLRLTDGGLEGVCDCPQGQDEVFCKHCVATALAWMRGMRSSIVDAHAVLPDLSELRQAIRLPDPWHAYSYFERVNAVLDRLAGSGDADAVADLVEHARLLLIEASEARDEEDSGFTAAVTRCEEIHLAACLAGSPDPVRLADTVVTRARSLDFEDAAEVVPAYFPALGRAGLARCRELLEAALADLPGGPASVFDSRRYAIAAVLDAAAEHERSAVR
ncbi:SWIM zinc finger family protein [Amycolatopsis suaedae]|uniref:SWIM-type domain-containing protein n=1 Tax=Amycolatopsis suaedae TaxID=2510978 RepID=A0A4Q7JA57_9PSEU|nr:hypothetical protein [Amycolatopsis suaedae]RZQ63343.1 hypothetical protein EWH70_12880 [Amycolatopsis suaedae]